MQKEEDQEPKLVPFILPRRTVDEKISALLTECESDLLDEEAKAQLAALVESTGAECAFVTVTLRDEEKQAAEMIFALELITKAVEGKRLSVKYTHTLYVTLAESLQIDN